jgi:hypothetical protein
MDSKVAAGNKVQSCDHKPLQECLAKNNNERSKCMKEWNEFQEQCRRARQVLASEPLEREGRGAELNKTLNVVNEEEQIQVRKNQN